MDSHPLKGDLEAIIAPKFKSIDNQLQSHSAMLAELCDRIMQISEVLALDEAPAEVLEVPAEVLEEPPEEAAPVEDKEESSPSTNKKQESPQKKKEEDKKKEMIQKKKEEEDRKKEIAQKKKEEEDKKKEMIQKKKEAEEERKRELQQKKKEEEERKKEMMEKKREEMLQKKKEEEQKRQEMLEKKKEDMQRKKEEEQKRKEEAAKKKEQDKQKRLEEQKAKQEESKRKNEEAKHKKAEELKSKQEEHKEPKKKPASKPKEPVEEEVKVDDRDRLEEVNNALRALQQAHSPEALNLEKPFELTIGSKSALPLLKNMSEDKFYLDRMPSEDVVWAFRIFFQFLGESLPLEGSWTRAQEFFRAALNRDDPEQSMVDYIIDVTANFNFTEENIDIVEELVKGQEDKINPKFFTDSCPMTGLFMFLIREAATYAGILKAKVPIWRQYKRLQHKKLLLENSLVQIS